MVKHNDMAIFITKYYGIRERRALIFKERINGRYWEDYTNGYDSYLCGYEPPNYPVPAIWKCPLCMQDSNNHYLACSATWSDFDASMRDV